MSFYGPLFQEHVTSVRTTYGGPVIDVADNPQIMLRAAAYPQTTDFGQSQLEFSVPKNVEVSEIIITHIGAVNASMPFDFGPMVGRTPSLSSNPYCSGN